MEFIADLHVHSKYSRATAKNLDLENLYVAAQLKGVTVVGTGDFTYPAWFSEICEKLEPAEAGLFKLKKEYAGNLQQGDILTNTWAWTALRFNFEPMTILFSNGELVKDGAPFIEDNKDYGADYIIQY